VTGRCCSADGRIGGRRKKLDVGKRHEIAERVINGRKSGAGMARVYNIRLLGEIACSRRSGWRDAHNRRLQDLVHVTISAPVRIRSEGSCQC
jgi:hypothetical protein